ncbi:MAG: DNA repair protein RecN [Rhodospirillales bacterium]|jgi:DNA repair protein RecN (Recombination protein N)|nr:DNA repair protein RecN [Rhodospirillales bacterium]MDP6803888.1 DNA repair protein RecN [Rhodospirillales bacterium]
MLRALSIRDVVLVRSLQIEFLPRLCVLSGETGAGKSILLDALGLAVGSRADSALIRHGATQATVAAEFEVSADHPVRLLLEANELDASEHTIVLRRVVGTDGRSRAFVNDQPISIALQRALGDCLVEIHGQFESRRLLDPAAQRDLLDAYGGLHEQVSGVAHAHGSWRTAMDALSQGIRERADASRDEDVLRHALDELSALDPQPGEESTLAAQRAVMMHGEKLVEATGRAADELGDGRGVEGAINAAQRQIEAVAELAGGRLGGAIAALKRASIEVADAASDIESVASDIDLDPRSLERIEERLFALRALARKHGVEADTLGDVGDELGRRLALVADWDTQIVELTGRAEEARGIFAARCQALSRARRKAAARLDGEVTRELVPLKLEAARFVARVDPLDDEQWGPSGADRVGFAVATNPQTPEGPLGRIASGGELARFTLALKVALARADPVPTIVFDEVDNGVGGAVAAAVGERLARLARDFQVLVVTHSPQVAARGDHHWRVTKANARPGSLTTVDALGDAERREEIARMLAGARVTDEARAAAGRLLHGALQ